MARLRALRARSAQPHVQARLAATVLACMPLVTVGVVAVLDPAFVAYAWGMLLGKAAAAYAVVSAVAGLVVAWRGPTGPSADGPS